MKLRYVNASRPGLDIAFEMPDTTQIIEMSRLIIDIVGREDVSAGTSFFEEVPVRDMQFEFDTFQEAEDAEKRLRCLLEVVEE